MTGVYEEGIEISSFRKSEIFLMTEKEIISFLEISCTMNVMIILNFTSCNEVCLGVH